MDVLHFLSYCAAVAAFFIWNQSQRKSTRLRRVLGAVVIIVCVGLVLPWAIQHVGSK